MNTLPVKSPMAFYQQLASLRIRFITHRAQLSKTDDD